MPQLQASKKALRVTKRRTIHNKAVMESIRASISTIRKAATAGKKDEGVKELKSLNSKLDRAVKNNIMKKNTAGRYKSRLSKLVQGGKSATKETAPASTA